jgi:ATP-binding cassette subfamily B protein
MVRCCDLSVKSRISIIVHQARPTISESEGYMIKLFRAHLKGYAFLCAFLAPLFMLLEVFMDLQQPTLMSNIIDIGVAAGDLEFVLRTGVHMIIFALVGLIGGAGCSILSFYASMHMAGSVRRSLFEKIFLLSSAEVNRFEASSLITRLTSDVTQIQDTLAMMLRGMSRGPMLLTGGVIMSFVLSARLALILCVALPLLTLSVVIIVKRTVPMYATVQSSVDNVNMLMRENLLGIQLVKSFSLESKRTSQFRQINDSLAENSIRAQSSTFLMMPIVTLLMNLSVVAILWFGGMPEVPVPMEIGGSLPNGDLSVGGGLSVGKIMALVNYMVQITSSLTMMVNFAANVSRSQASASRIHEVSEFSSQRTRRKQRFALPLFVGFSMDTEPSIAHPRTMVSIISPEIPVPQDDSAAQQSVPPPTRLSVEFNHVSFGYGGEPVLKDISFSAAQGQKLGVIGPTGCGKSTLAALLARLYDPSGGSVVIGGVDARDISNKVLHKKVCLITQDSVLFSGTVADNLRYGSETAGEAELWEAAEAAEAAGFLRELPDGLDTVVTQRGKNFSGGQKQRLCIARALVLAPDILVMDDSTSALDLLTEARLRQAVRKRMRNAILIIISQRVSSIIDCDSILVMDNGRIAAQGGHAELMRHSALYRSIALSQLGEEAIDYA